MSFVGLLDVGETATSLREMAAHDAPRFEYRVLSPPLLSFVCPNATAA